MLSSKHSICTAFPIILLSGVVVQPGRLSIHCTSADDPPTVPVPSAEPTVPVPVASSEPVFPVRQSPVESSCSIRLVPRHPFLIFQSSVHALRCQKLFLDLLRSLKFNPSLALV